MSVCVCVCVCVCAQRTQFGQAAHIYTTQKKDKKLLPYKVFCGERAELFYVLSLSSWQQSLMLGHRVFLLKAGAHITVVSLVIISLQMVRLAKLDQVCFSLGYVVLTAGR